MRLPLFRRAERKDNVSLGWDSLSAAERKITQLVRVGFDQPRDCRGGARLGMSPFTVDGRIRRTQSKPDVNSRLELSTEVARTTR